MDALVQQQFDMQALLSREIDAAQAMSYNEYAQVLEATNPATGQATARVRLASTSDADHVIGDARAAAVQAGDGDGLATAEDGIAVMKALGVLPPDQGISSTRVPPAALSRLQAHFCTWLERCW